MTSTVSLLASNIPSRHRGLSHREGSCIIGKVDKRIFKLAHRYGSGRHLFVHTAAAAASSSSSSSPSSFSSSSSSSTTSPPAPPAPPVDKDAPPRWSLVHARAVAAITEVIVSRKDAQKVVRKALRPEWFGPEGAKEAPGWGGDARGGGVNNAERAAIADAVLGVTVLRLRLAFIALTRVSSRAASSVEALDAVAGGRDAFGADALAALLRRGGINVVVVDDDDGDGDDAKGGACGLRVSSDGDGAAAAAADDDNNYGADDDLDRADVTLAVESMLALYWMRDDEDEVDEGDQENDDEDERDASASTSQRRRRRRQMEEAKLAVLCAASDEVDWPTDPTRASSLAAALLSQGPVTLRRNRRLCPSADELRAALAAEGVEAVPLTEFDADATAPSAGAPDALVLPAGRPRCGIFGLDTYHRGWFEVQDAGSQCISRAVADAVLAMAAAEAEAEGEAAEGKIVQGLAEGIEEMEGVAEGTSAPQRRRSGRSRRRRGKRIYRVLDMCAGNGGKALAVASALSSTFTASASASAASSTSLVSDDDGGGEIAFCIDCYDVDERRLRHLRAASERAGMGARVNAVTASHLRAVALATKARHHRGAGAETGAETGAGAAKSVLRDDDVDDDWNGDADGDVGSPLPSYDVVLVDVPCSSTGALRRFPSLRWEMEESKVISAPEAVDDADDEDAGAGGRRGLHSFGWDADDATAGGFDADADADADAEAALSRASDSSSSSASSSSSSSSSSSLSPTWQALQRGILGRAAALVRPRGGALVYATCSLLDAENGDNVRWFERRRWGDEEDEKIDEEPGEEVGGGRVAEERGTRFMPLPFPADWPAEEREEIAGGGTAGVGASSPRVASHEVALTPHVHGTDGFYIARWVRS